MQQFGELLQCHGACIGALAVGGLYEQQASIVGVKGVRKVAVLGTFRSLHAGRGGDQHELGGLGDQQGQQRLPGKSCGR